MNIVAFYENRGKFTGGFLKNLAQNIENARNIHYRRLRGAALRATEFIKNEGEKLRKNATFNRKLSRILRKF